MKSLPSVFSVVCIGLLGACSGGRDDTDDGFAGELSSMISLEIRAMLAENNVDAAEFERVWSMTVDEYSDCLAHALLTSNRPESDSFVEAMSAGLAFQDVEDEIRDTSLHYQAWEDEIKRELRNCGRR